MRGHASVLRPAPGALSARQTSRAAPASRGLAGRVRRIRRLLVAAADGVPPAAEEPSPPPPRGSPSLSALALSASQAAARAYSSLRDNFAAAYQKHGKSARMAGIAGRPGQQHAGVPVLLVEASDGVGGRVRTDEVEGFLLDRGFQIFLTSYPEAQAALDYPALDLQPFYAGALVRFAGGFHTVADPFRHMVDALGSLSPSHPIGSPADKIKVGLFRLKSLLGSLEDLLAAPEVTTLQRLREEGFSEAIIDRFFRPFLGGIFFDRSLGVTSRIFAFVMRMLATGQNCLPADGIGVVSDQLASRLPASAIRLNCAAAAVAPAGAAGGPAVTLADGTQLAAGAVVVAVEGPEAARLLGPVLEASPSKAAAGVGTCCLYFKAPRPARPGNTLYLDGEGKGIVNNMCFPSEVSRSYAPAGQTLVSVSTIGTLPELSEGELVAAVKAELGGWFGAGEVAGWQHLKTYRIPFAQPGQAPPTNLDRPVSLGGGLYVCGDHRATATLDGALTSGRLAAEAVLAARRQGGGKAGVEAAAAAAAQ
ncbi:Amine oxidase family [Micractinium conductrix]|uniref:Amine oxidase family n=1 Tax=Micractinium conductrix TaxID=554055 RepID=A0A2P6VRM4_9CHLO|nr:Amine oxidase family [Micractinium conductrix]|eukprot:PSC76748.1 Amine oxidase family [Micractinium conductrix]